MLYSMVDPRHPHSELLLKIDSAGEVPCKNFPSVYFPEDINDRQVRAEAVQVAKRLCGECPIVSDCLEYALFTSQEYGIWGGLTASERHKLKKSSSE
jgi:WhiB family redox-sensing transcriptional regulator